MHRVLGLTAAAVMTLTAVAGCGGDDSTPSGNGGYCADLSATKDQFIGLLDNQIDQQTFEALQNRLHSLKKESPVAIADDWTTFSDAVDAFAVAMNKAGLTMDDMRDMGTGDMAGGTDMQTAMDAAVSLGSAAVSTAQSRIAANALKQCQVDLNS